MMPLHNCLMIALAACGALACGSAQSEPATPAGEAPTTAGEPPPAEAGEAGAPRPSVTAQECETGGGTVVGDIGDGAVHRPDYKCASGAAPTASIRAAEGGPVAIEGSVCCPK